MKIAVLHNHVPENAGPEDKDTLVQATAVHAALEQLGHEADLIPCSLDLEWLKAGILCADCDLVFNLVEGLDGHGRLIHVAPDLLESIPLPFTGAPAEAIYLTSNKILGKRVMRSAGIDTPDWFAASGPCSREFDPRGRFIIKSVWEHASFGMGETAVIDSLGENDLASAIARKERETLRPFLAERYVDGREFNIAVLAGPEGPEILPIGEIDFSSFPPGRPRIVDYRAKWIAGTFEYENTYRKFNPSGKDSALFDRLASITLDCWRLFNLRGYARVDFRVDTDGRPWVLEVNANPCISPDAGFSAALDQACIPYEEAIRRIVADSPPPAVRCPAAPCEPFAAGFTIRDRLGQGDPRKIRDLVAETGFFSGDEVEVAVELAIENAARGAQSGYDFLVVERAGELAGYACFGPVPCTASSFDLYWIAVKPSMQGAGLGRKLFARVVQAVRSLGGTRIYADTSGRTQYAPTRDFYERAGFARECEQNDFYGPGDSRVLYCKDVSRPEA